MNAPKAPNKIARVTPAAATVPHRVVALDKVAILACVVKLEFTANGPLIATVAPVELISSHLEAVVFQA